MTDDDLANMAEDLSKALPEIGRLGVRYPGELAIDFDPEEEETEENESPDTEEAQRELNRRTRNELDPHMLSDDALEYLTDHIGPDGIAELRRAAIYRL